jgi:putative chitinase
MLDVDKVRRLQARVGVTADGSFGPNTLDAVLAALGVGEAAPPAPPAAATSGHDNEAFGFAMAALRGVFGGAEPVADVPAPAPVAPSPASVAGGDDRYLPLFQRLASQNANPETVKLMARAFAKHAPAFGQDATKPRIAEFVAQTANETGGFRVFHENLNYSATRIPQVWPSRFGPGKANAAACAHNPEALANVVYQRPKEGNTQPGDGWRYRGRGALQLTFRNNYRHFGQLLGVDLEGNPDLAADPAVSVLIALQFFKVGKVNAAIDRGDFREARRITNGADLGLDEVARLRAKAMAVLG